MCHSMSNIENTNDYYLSTLDHLRVHEYIVIDYVPQIVTDITIKKIGAMQGARYVTVVITKDFEEKINKNEFAVKTYYRNSEKINIKIPIIESCTYDVVWIEGNIAELLNENLDIEQIEIKDTKLCAIIKENINKDIETRLKILKWRNFTKIDILTSL